MSHPVPGGLGVDRALRGGIDRYHSFSVTALPANLLRSGSIQRSTVSAVALPNVSYPRPIALWFVATESA